MVIVDSSVSFEMVGKGDEYVTGIRRAGSNYIWTLRIERVIEYVKVQCKPSMRRVSGNGRGDPQGDLTTVHCHGGTIG